MEHLTRPFLFVPHCLQQLLPVILGNILSVEVDECPLFGQRSYCPNVPNCFKRYLWKWGSPRWLVFLEIVSQCHTINVPRHYVPQSNAEIKKKQKEFVYFSCIFKSFLGSLCGRFCRFHSGHMGEHDDGNQSHISQSEFPRENKRDHSCTSHRSNSCHNQSQKRSRCLEIEAMLGMTYLSENNSWDKTSFQIMRKLGFLIVAKLWLLLWLQKYQ